MTKLAANPLFTITTYQGYDVNGNRFYTKDQDAKSMYQNNGVHVDAIDSDMATGMHYGQIEEIWELNYVGFKVALF
jgi:hypothetical protein